jgi:Skp family chaperone for outer membrane proteins
MATRLAVGVVAIVAFCGTYELRAVAVGQNAVAGSVRVAVLDVGDVIQHHVRLQQQLGKLNSDVRQAEEALQHARAEMEELAQQSRDFQAHTPERKSLEDRLMHRQAEVEARFSLERKAFYEQESRMYGDVARELNEVVRQYANEHGISLVLRISRAPVDLNNRESILSEINKEVVFSSDGDITSAILAELNRQAAP